MHNTGSNQIDDVECHLTVEKSNQLAAELCLFEFQDSCDYMPFERQLSHAKT
jgi:hypothetical protein